MGTYILGIEFYRKQPYKCSPVKIGNTVQIQLQTYLLEMFLSSHLCSEWMLDPTASLKRLQYIIDGISSDNNFLFLRETIQKIIIILQIEKDQFVKATGLKHVSWNFPSGPGVGVCLRMWGTQVQSLGWKDSLEEEMATHSSLIARAIPWTKEPGRLQVMG